MNNTKEDNALIELDKRLRESETRIKPENWKLIHTSMDEEEEHDKYNMRNTNRRNILVSYRLIDNLS